MDEIKRIFHTIKYLRTKQVYYQLYYRLVRNSLDPVIRFLAKPLLKRQAIKGKYLKKSSAHKIYDFFEGNFFFQIRPQWAFERKFMSKSLDLRQWNHQWDAPLLPKPIISTTGEISFLNELACFDESIDWNDPKRSKLWLYNLHYFNVLNSINANFHVELLNRLNEKWIHENPPGLGNGWEPYTLSLRIVNLIKWYSKQQEVKQEWLISLQLQIDALLGKIEYHILGNHILANAKALIFAGVYFEGTKADFCLQKGLEILDREINEQFLADGGHYELSTMYHALLLWDLCDLVKLALCSNLPQLLIRLDRWHSSIQKGLDWLNAMCHPDGEISFFNDAAFDIAPTLFDIESYVQQLNFRKHSSKEDDLVSGVKNTQKISVTSGNTPGIFLHLLKDSGYCVLNLSNACKAILDVAKIGPDYQPGHAHADTLSFELSLYGQRFLVNSGTSTYRSGIQRQHERSTKAHNTVTINNKNSSDVWAEFRVAKRAYPKDLFVDYQPQRVVISCAHDGYTRFIKPCIHRREWTFHEQELTIRDVITGNDKKQAESRLYFHPNIQIICLEQGVIQCQLQGNRTAFIHLTGATQYSLESTFWYPCFGTAIENRCLVVLFTGKQLITKIAW